MTVPLSYGIKKEVPLDHGIKKEPDLSYGLDIKPESRFQQYRNPPKKPFGAKHPNLYGMYGAGKELGKQIIPFIKYVDPAEREKFLKLSQQHQTRDILFETMNAVLLGALKPIGQGVKAVAKPALQRWLPKTYKTLTKPIGKTATVDGATTLPIKEPIASSVKTPTKDIIKQVEALGVRSTTVLPKREPAAQSLKYSTKDIIKQIKALDEGVTNPKYAGSVNLDRQAIPKEMKLMELRAAESTPKKSVSWAQTDKASNAIINDPKKIRAVAEKIRDGSALNAAESDAIRKANVSGLFKFQERIKSATTPEEINAIQDAYRTKLFKPVSQAASEAGRTLNIYNREIGLNRIGKAIGKLERNLNPRELKEFKALDFDDSIKVKHFIDRLGNPKIMDYVYEYWYNMILSGIPTHVVNIASNTAWRMFQIPHRALTGATDAMVSTLTGNQRTRYISETLPLMAGLFKGKVKAAKSAWQVARHGKLQEFETKWAQEIGSSLGAFDRSPSKIVRGVGKAITVPTKALRAMDVYANSLAYDAQLNALARRAAIKKGLKGSVKKQFQKDFVLNPTNKVHNQAMEFAKYTTFMSDPGFVSKAIMKLRGKIPGARLVVPFVNTIGNLTKRGVEMTPGLGLALAKGQKPAEVIAKQIEGSIVSLYMLNMAAEGKVTGALPENKAEREAFYRQGKKPWAIKVGDEWYEYRRVEPMNTILASTAIAYDRIKNAKDEETASEIFFNMSGDLKNNLLDSGYLQGVTRILNRHGGVKGMAPRLAASFVPYSSFLRSINRAYEAQTEGSAKVREGNEWHKAFSETTLGLIPALPKTPVKLDVWGEEIDLQGGVFRQWLPYRWATETDDITEKSLETLKVYPGLPRKKFTYKRKKHEMDEDIYRNYAIAYGNRAKKYLDHKFSQPLWKRALKNEKQHDKLRAKIDSKLKAIRYKEQRRAVIEQRRRWKIKKLSNLP